MSGSDSGTYVRLMTVLKTESREVPNRDLVGHKPEAGKTDLSVS
jgi:hypothetical protein